MIWIDTTEDQRFYVGDSVKVNGYYKGTGEVFCAYYKEEHDKRIANGGGEISYLFKVNESFPQIGVRLDDGNDIHYNGDDIAMGKITLISRPDKPKELSIAIDIFTGDITIS